MGTDNDKGRDDLREAYRRGLEQGYYLGRKMRESGDRGGDEEGGPGEAPDAGLPLEVPLFLRQIIGIAHQHGVDYE